MSRAWSGQIMLLSKAIKLRSNNLLACLRFTFLLLLRFLWLHLHVKYNGACFSGSLEIGTKWTHMTRTSLYNSVAEVWIRAVQTLAYLKAFIVFHYVDKTN